MRNMTLIVAASAAVGFVLMLAAYSLPNEKIFANVKASLHLYEIEYDHYFWGLDKLPTDVDNFTNAIMLMEAIYPAESDVLDSALVNRMWNLEGNSPIRTLMDGINTNRQADLNKDTKYGRYWHGYLIFLKPLLCVTNVGNIRLLNSYVQFLLFVIVFVLLYRRLGVRYVLAFAVTILAINPVTTALCFQNSTTLYVTLLGMIFLLLKNDWLAEKSRYVYFFLLLGICTAYFDLLTYPLVAFGVPLCLFVVLNKEKFFPVPIKDAAKKIFRCAFGWGFGYAGMWASKWILATALTDYNALFDAFGNAIYSKLSSVTVGATSGAGVPTFAEYVKFLLSPTPALPPGYFVKEQITILEVFQKNIFALFDTPFFFIFGLFVLYMIFRLIRRKQKPAVNLNVAGIFAFAAALPFVWYAAIIKHSYIHTFLVHRDLAVSIFAVACFLAVLEDDAENRP